MTNTTPIDTQTKVIKIPISAKLDENIKSESDFMGDAGLHLSSSFVLGDAIVLIFQRTR